MLWLRRQIDRIWSHLERQFELNWRIPWIGAQLFFAWNLISVNLNLFCILHLSTRKHPQGKVARRAFCVGSAHTNFALRSTIHSTNIRPQIMCLGSNMPDWRKKHGWLQMMSRWSVWSLCHASILKKLGTYTKRKTPKPVSRLRSERYRHTHRHTHTEHHPNLSSPTQKALRAIIIFGFLDIRDFL